VRPLARLSLALLLVAAGAGVALAAGPGADATADATPPSDVGAQVMFWLLALLVVGGAITTIVQKNTITAVMALVATFFGLAGLYLMLSAQFLAALQVLVYAGAIMTLFVFVVMVLNREEAEPFVMRGWITKGLGVLASAWLAIKAGSFLFAEQPSKVEAPPPEFGGVADVGYSLFTRYLFPFEALSLMLLVAVIGAVVVARTPKRQADDHSGGLSHHEPEGDARKPPHAAHPGGGAGH
jgi:NADH-quinone oxidoreductase subunit J